MFDAAASSYSSPRDKSDIRERIGEEKIESEISERKKKRERKLLKKKTLRVTRKKERENDKCVTPEIVVR